MSDLRAVRDDDDLMDDEELTHVAMSYGDRVELTPLQVRLIAAELLAARLTLARMEEVAWAWLRRWRFGPLSYESGGEESKARAMADLRACLKPRPADLRPDQPGDC